ncbi:MAG: hypothetical protein JNK58_10290 [Phycisphaerae bacterium]|nr:hypothetical protein [Phycisphaerae bacterium]
MRLQSISFATTLTLALIAPATAHDEILCGTDGAGNLKARLDIIQPLLLDQDFAGFDGISGAPAGLTTPTADEPEEGLFVLPPASNIVFVLVNAGHGITMYNGLTPMIPGDYFPLGAPYFHSHPVWTIQHHHAGETIALTGFFRDLAGLNADSEVFQMTFTTLPPPCDGDFSGDDAVNFVDITQVLANWGNPYDFTAITTVLANWGSDCGHVHP